MLKVKQYIYKGIISVYRDARSRWPPGLGGMRGVPFHAKIEMPHPTQFKTLRPRRRHI